MSLHWMKPHTRSRLDFTQWCAVRDEIWRSSQQAWLPVTALLLLVSIAGCGPEQQATGGQTSGSVPVSLNISMPQASAAASTSENRFWAKIRSWFPSPTSAWAVTYNLSELTVTVTDSSQQLLTTKTEKISKTHESNELISITLDVPVGPDRIFAVSGQDRVSGKQTLNGKSTPTTLIEGQAAAVEIILTNVSPTGTVTGTVRNQGTGATLSGATADIDGLSTTTNGDGGFTLNEIPQGPQTLTVKASGFMSTTRSVTVVAGTSVSAGSIELTPIPTTGSVTGTVTNQRTGIPVPGATVAVGGISKSTLADGTFTLDGVPQGAQTITISASGFTLTTRAVTVVAGTSVSAGSIALSPIPTTGSVTGTVTNATGVALRGATVAVLETKIEDTTDSEGKFTLNGVSQGQQTLFISAPGFTSRSQDVTVVAESSVSAGTIALTPIPPTTGTVRGNVINAGTERGFPNATVVVLSLGQKPTTVTNFNGDFTLNDIPQGPQTIMISADGHASKRQEVKIVAGSSVTAGTISLNPAELENIRVTDWVDGIGRSLCLDPKGIQFPLDPSFDPENSDYTANVGQLPPFTGLCIVMTRAHAEQTVTINGTPPDPTPGDPIGLFPIFRAPFPEVFTIVVTAPDRETEKTYTITPQVNLD